MADLFKNLVESGKKIINGTGIISNTANTILKDVAEPTKTVQANAEQLKTNINNTIADIKTNGVTAIPEAINENLIQPNVFDRYNDTTERISNSKYLVHEASKSDLDYISQNSDNFELWNLENSTKSAYDTAYGTRNVGKHTLEGVSDSDKFVLYDKSTGKIMKYKQETEPLKSIRSRYTVFANQASAIEKEINDTLGNYQTQLTSIRQRIDAATTYDQRNALWNAYNALSAEANQYYTAKTAQYSVVQAEYNSLKTQYDSTGTVAPDSGFASAMDRWYADSQKAKEQYESIYTDIADTTNPEQVNSSADVLKRSAAHFYADMRAKLDEATGADPTEAQILQERYKDQSFIKDFSALADKNIFANTVRDFLVSGYDVTQGKFKEALEMFYKEYPGSNLVEDGTISTSKAAMINVINVLVGLGEDMDAAGASEIKAIVNSPGMSSVDALKAVFGINKDYDGMPNFDYDTGSGVLDFGLEMLSDPGTWISFGSKGLLESSMKKAMKSTDITKLGIEIVDEDISKLAKQTANLVMHDGYDVDVAARKAMDAYLLREKLLVDLKDVSGVDYSTLRQNLNKLVTPNGNYNLTAVQSTLQKTQMSDAAINSILANMKKAPSEIMQTSNLFVDSLSNVSAYRVAGLMQKINDINEGTQRLILNISVPVKPIFAGSVALVHKIADTGIAGKFTRLITRIASKTTEDIVLKDLVNNTENEVDDFLRSFIKTDSDTFQATSTLTEEAKSSIYTGYVNTLLRNIQDSMRTGSDVNIDDVIFTYTKGAYKNIEALYNDLNRLGVYNRLDLSTKYRLDDLFYRMSENADAVKLQRFKQTMANATDLKNTFEEFANKRGDIFVSAESQYRPRTVIVQNISKYVDAFRKYSFEEGTVSAATVSRYYKAVEDFMTAYKTGVVETDVLDNAFINLQETVDAIYKNADANMKHFFVGSTVESKADLVLDAANAKEKVSGYKGAKQVAADILRKYGKDDIPVESITTEDIHQAISARPESKYYSFDLLKSTKRNLLFESTALQRAEEIVLGTKGGTPLSIATFFDHTSISTVAHSFASMNVERDLREFISKNVSADLQDALFDTVAGYATLLNKKVTALGYAVNKAQYSRGLQDIKDILTFASIDFINKSSNSYHNYTSMVEHTSRGLVNYNDADVKTAIENLMLDLSDTENKHFKTAREFLATDADKYHNVYLSLGRASDQARPSRFAFGNDDGSVISFAVKEPFVGSDTVAKKLHGVGASDIQSALTKYYANPDVNVYDDVAEFNDEVKTYLETQSRIASTNGKQLRVIMHNSGKDTTSNANALNTYMYRNLMETYIPEIVDVADFVRIDKGFVKYTDAFSKDVDAFVNTMLDRVEANTKLYNSGRVVPFVDADKLYSATKNMYNQKASYDLIPELASVSDNIEEVYEYVDSYKLLAEENSNLDRSVLDMSKLEEIVGRQNITAELFSNPDNITTAIVRWDYGTVHKWFDSEDFEYRDVADAMVGRYTKETAKYSMFMDKAKAYEDKIGQLVNVAYATDFRTSEIKTLMNVCNKYIKRLSGADELLYKTTISNLMAGKYDRTVKQFVIFDEYFYKVFDNAKFEEDMAKAVANKNQVAIDALKEIESAVKWYESVQDYFLGRSNFQLTKTSSKYSAYDLTDAVFKDMENLSVSSKDFIRKLEGMSYVRAEQSDPAAINQMIMLNKQSLLRPVKKITNTVDGIRNSLYFEATTETTGLEQFNYLKSAAAQVNAISIRLSDYRRDYDSLRAAHIFQLPADQLEAFVVRNCANALIIQPTMVAIAEDTATRNAFMRFLETIDTKRLYKKTLDDGSILIQSRQAIALKKSGDEYGKFLESMDALEKSIDYKDLKVFMSDKKYIPDVSGYMPGKFYASTFNTFTQDSYKALENVAGAGLVDNQLMQKMGWFNNTFSSSVIGDAEFVKKYFPYSSSNILNNMYNGMSLISSGFEYVQSVGNITNSPHVRLSSFINNLAYTQDWSKDADTIQKAIDTANWRVCTFEYKNINGVKTVVGLQALKLNKDNIERLVKDQSVMLLDSSMHTSVGAFLKAEHAERVTKTISDLINKGGILGNAVKFYKVAENFLKATQRIRYYFWLFSKTGTWINNGLDSNFKAAISTQSIDFLKNRHKYIERLSRYEDMRGHIIVDANNMDLTRIHAWYNSDEAKSLYGNPEAYLSERDFIKIYAINTHQSGSIVQDIVENIHKNQAAKLAHQMGVPDESAYVATLKEHEYEFSKLWAKNTNTLGEINYAALQKDLDKYIDSTDLSYKSELKDVIMNYVPELPSITDRVKDVPLVGKYYAFNQDMFGKIEQHSRTALAMYFMDYFSDSPAKAIERMLETQFDYSNRTTAADVLNTAIPFSTFKVMNAKYWLNAYQTDVVTNHLVNNAVQTLILPDAWELAKSYYWQNQFSEEDSSKDGEPQLGFADTLAGDIMQPYESNSIYAALKGNIDFMGINVKYNFTFMDAINIYAQLIQTAITGDVKNLFADQVYSPIVTLSSFFENLITGDESIQSWLNTNQYNVIDYMPIFGTIINSLVAKAKQGVLSSTDLKLAFSTQSSTLFDIIGATLTTAFSSILSTTRKALPVGYDWNNQTDEYKSTHRYIYGVSSVPTFVEKDPAKYIDNMGIFISMGYTKQEALELLNKGWYFDADGNAHQYNMYSDNEMPNLFKYNNEVFDDTLKYLLTRGYTFQDAYTLMQKGGIWVDETGTERTDTDVKQLLDGSVFYRKYSQLPDYVKNIPNQYAAQIKYYRDTYGMSSDEALIYMDQNNVFIDGDGNVSQLSPDDVKTLNATYPDAVSEKQPATKTYSSSSTGYTDTFNTRNITQDHYRFNTKSQYPEAYRNIAWDQRRDIYRDQYMSNGAPIRTMMKSTRYYNNSTMRFKMEWRHNRFDYIRRRSESRFDGIMR